MHPPSHSVSLQVLSLDVMDVSGEQHLDVDHNVFKENLDEDGAVVGGVEKHGATQSLLVLAELCVLPQSCTGQRAARRRRSATRMGMW